MIKKNIKDAWKDKKDSDIKKQSLLLAHSYALYKNRLIFTDTLQIIFFCGIFICLILSQFIPLFLWLLVFVMYLLFNYFATLIHVRNFYVRWGSDQKPARKESTLQSRGPKITKNEVSR